MTIRFDDGITNGDLFEPNYVTDNFENENMSWLRRYLLWLRKWTVNLYNRLLADEERIKELEERSVQSRNTTDIAMSNTNWVPASSYLDTTLNIIRYSTAPVAATTSATIIYASDTATRQLPFTHKPYLAHNASFRQFDGINTWADLTGNSQVYDSNNPIYLLDSEMKSLDTLDSQFASNLTNDINNANNVTGPVTHGIFTFSNAQSCVIATDAGASVVDTWAMRSAAIVATYVTGSPDGNGTGWARLYIDCDVRTLSYSSTAGLSVRFNGLTQNAGNPAGMPPYPNNSTANGAYLFQQNGATIGTPGAYGYLSKDLYLLPSGAPTNLVASSGTLDITIQFYDAPSYDGTNVFGTVGNWIRDYKAAANGLLYFDYSFDTYV